MITLLKGEVHLLFHQTIGHTVEVAGKLDMVIDMHPGFLPVGKLVGAFRQGQHGRQVEFRKAALPATGQLLEGVEVQEGKAFPNGGIGFGQAEERSLPEARQDETLGDQHSAFDLVLGMTHTGRNNSGTVMLCKFGVRPVQLRLIATGFVYCGSEVLCEAVRYVE